MNAARLGFWNPFDSAIAARLSAWLASSAAVARRLYRQESSLSAVANWQANHGIIPAGANGLGLTAAIEANETAAERYQYAMAQIVYAAAQAIGAKRIDPSAIKFGKVYRDGRLEGLGELSAFLIVAVVVGAAVISGLWFYLTNRDNVIRAIGDVENNSALVDGFLVHADRYMKANPTAPPPAGPVFTDTGSGSLGFVGPLIGVVALLGVVQAVGKGGR